MNRCPYITPLPHWHRAGHLTSLTLSTKWRFFWQSSSRVAALPWISRSQETRMRQSKCLLLLFSHHILLSALVYFWDEKNPNLPHFLLNWIFLTFWFIFLHFSGRVGFFDISTSYTMSLMTSVLFTLGFLLVIDLALGKINIFNIINGVSEEAPRAGRSLLDPLYALIPRIPGTDVIMDEVVNTVNQISEAIEKFENRNNPRAF